jgi:hypothetical protein
MIFLHKEPFINNDQGILTERVGSVQLTSFFRSGAFKTEKSIYFSFFNKTSFLKEEVNCTEPSPSVSVTCSVQLFIYLSVCQSISIIEEVNCTEPSPSVSIPWLDYQVCQLKRES